jgi:signal transduction histidine kinase
VVDPVIELLKVHAEVASVELQVRYEMQEDPFVSVDKTRTQQILLNLI